MAFNRWNNDVIPEGLKRKKFQQTLFSFLTKVFRSKLNNSQTFEYYFKKKLADILHNWDMLVNNGLGQILC
jgi:hypothetical protein